MCKGLMGKGLLRFLRTMEEKYIRGDMFCVRVSMVQWHKVIPTGLLLA